MVSRLEEKDTGESSAIYDEVQTRLWRMSGTSAQKGLVGEGMAKGDVASSILYYFF